MVHTKWYEHTHIRFSLMANFNMGNILLVHLSTSSGEHLYSRFLSTISFKSTFSTSSANKILVSEIIILKASFAKFLHWFLYCAMGVTPVRSDQVLYETLVVVLPDIAKTLDIFFGQIRQEKIRQVVNRWT
jgi:hypothetical protein